MDRKFLVIGLDCAAPELQAKAAEVFPRARAMLGKAIKAGVTKHPERHQETIRRLETWLAQHAEGADG